MQEAARNDHNEVVTLLAKAGGMVWEADKVRRVCRKGGGGGEAAPVVRAAALLACSCAKGGGEWGV